MNLREQVEHDLGLTLESGDDWGLPVELRSPDGVIQKKTVVCTASDISFAATDRSVNSTSTDFRNFEISDGDELQFSGSVANTGTYTVSSIAENKIILEESVVDEAAGSEVKVINLDVLRGNPKQRSPPQSHNRTILYDLRPGFETLLNRMVNNTAS